MIGEDLLSEAERVSDRLRLLLPRLLARADDAPGRDLLVHTRLTLQALADAGAAAQGRVDRHVPEVAVHAVPDQVLVLAQDLVSGPPEADAFVTDAAADAALEQAVAAGLEVLQQLRSRL